MPFKYSRALTVKGWQPSTILQFHSKRERKLRYFSKSHGRGVLVQSLQEPGLKHIFRADRTNCGDWWCLPANYFTFPDHDNGFDIFDLDTPHPIAGDMIIGGGGLIGPGFPQLEEILNNPGRKIGWGLGNNMLDDKKSAYVSQSAPLPKYIDKFDLIGIRDVIPGIRWVPCVSCMHPALSKSYKIDHEIVVFDHKRVPLHLTDHPTKNNNTDNINEIISFLGSGEIVITNSYHGAYWAQLLGKKVVAIPFSSKFYGFKHPIALGTKEDIPSLIKNSVACDEALGECRNENIKFYADVINLLN